MKKFFKNHQKLIVMSLLLVVFISACSSPRDRNGKIIPEQLISLNTSFQDCISLSWFNIFVWPLAQLINLIAKYTDAGIGIIVVTIILNFGIAILSIKQQVQMQRIQMLQPELQRIQAKYAGKTDQNSKMRQAQELQKIYNKYQINPFGSLIVTFIQFPVIFAVYQAVMRAETVVKGQFLGIALDQTPIDGFKALNWGVIIIFILMIVFQILSFKLPQLLQKHHSKKSKVKTKEYAQTKTEKDTMQSSMNMMMYMSLIMSILFSINWPLGMSFYWMVSSVTRVIQNIVIQKFFIEKE